jgi:hypothetical protein
MSFAPDETDIICSEGQLLSDRAVSSADMCPARCDSVADWVS